MSHLTKQQAVAIAGTLSKPSKMPCKGTSLPASLCVTGGKLRNVCGSVCSKCYAHKGMYVFPNVQRALNTRLAGITKPDWVSAMVTLIGNDPYFRWHDSGDIQNIVHLHNIVKVCYATPNTKHWLPTKERAILIKYLKHNKIPDNLTIRLSASMIDQRPPLVAGVNTSTVHSRASKMIYGQPCKAPTNDGACGDCRMCWSRDVANVSYLQH